VSEPINVHVHLDGHADQVSVTVIVGAQDEKIDELEEVIMTARDDLTASLTAVKTTLTEVTKDLARLVALFNDAVANGDLTAVQGLATELGDQVTALDAAIEAVAPEGTPEPEPEVP
jgi:methionine aminopeptidase